MRFRPRGRSGRSHRHHPPPRLPIGLNAHDGRVGTIHEPVSRRRTLGTLTNEAMPLSIADAIARGLQHNLGALMADESTDHARGVRREALSALLPNVNAHLSETRQKISLEAFGFPLPAGFPPLVGPFNVYDARVYLSQSMHRLARAERHARRDATISPPRKTRTKARAISSCS